MKTEFLICGDGLWDGRVLWFSELPSTNQWALEHAGECRHGDIVWASRQPSGRGRFGRIWLSASGRSLTFTVVLRYSSPFQWGANVGQAAAIAVHRVLAERGVASQLKWPNDVMVERKKIAGILLEKLPSGNDLVLGIGLNVNTTEEDFASGDLGDIATSMFMASAREFALREILDRLIRSLESTLGTLAQNGPADLFKEWRTCDGLEGQEIMITTAQGVALGRYAGIAEDGRLRLLVGPDKNEQLFWTGDAGWVRGR